MSRIMCMRKIVNLNQVKVRRDSISELLGKNKVRASSHVSLPKN